MSPEAGRLADTHRERGSVLGAILAGGRSRRFGWEKALFPLAGRPMAQWSVLALRPHTVKQVVVTNDPDVAEALTLQGWPDEVPEMGPLGGLHTALRGARREGARGVFLLACDLPLIGPELIGKILTAWPVESATVVPGSHGPLGFEPLCAAYDVECLPAVEELLSSSKRSMEALLERVGTFRIPPEALGAREDLNVAFTNVNTRAEAEAAAEILKQSSSGLSGGP